MLGAAVFLIQAGAVEIALRNDRLCREARSDNWAVNPKGCQTESVLFLLRGLSYGVVGIVRPGLPALGILSMALVMGAVAASLASLPARHAIPIFLIVEVMAASVFGAIAFLAFFVG
jgi:hypothetical protein